MVLRKPERQRKRPGMPERRNYVRLDSVCPVNFCLISLKGEQPVSDWIQGFTSNISRGGICLSVNNLKPHIVEMLEKKQVKLLLNIEMPLRKATITAKATVVWIYLADKKSDNYLIGLSYEAVPTISSNQLFRYALARRLIPRFAAVILFLLSISFSLSTYLNLKLISGNKMLVEQFVNIIQKSSIAKQKIKRLAQTKNELGLELSAMGIRLKTLTEEKQRVINAQKSKTLRRKLAQKKVNELDILIQDVEMNRTNLQERLINVQKEQNRITEDLLLLDKRKADLERANFEKMYQWLKSRQDPRTGLVVSYEADRIMTSWSFLYDQALVAIAYVNFSDFERARKIFDFFESKAKRLDQGFLNVYYTNDGKPVEYIVNSGPNIWLGIALLHYTKKTQDTRYLELAKRIGDWVLGLQHQNRFGGVRAGPKMKWYSVEHNLEAYALFTMLYQVTRDTKYDQAMKRSLNWLQMYISSHPDAPLSRGKGDSTIITGTNVFSICALGARKLEEFGIVPDQVIDRVEDMYLVENQYIRPSGENLRVKGFDFVPSRGDRDSGVISSEWTAQMILVYKLLADYYFDKDMLIKARHYEMKADDHLSQLCRLLISSPSPAGAGEGCLPFSTEDSIDTGHGWVIPHGKGTGSVAATSYALFAFYGNNPLELSN